MPLIDECILWSKMDNAGSVTSPEIGPGGTVNGGSITFIPVKFNNGIKSVNNGDYAYWASLLTPNKIMAEFWLMPDGYNIVDCDPDDNLFHEYFNMENLPGYVQFQCRPDDFFGPFIFDGVNAHDLRLKTGVDISDGEKVHILLVMDKFAGFDGLKTSAWYLDGVQMASSTNALNWTSPHNIIIGAERGSFLRPSKSGIDNLKIYDNVSAALIAEVIANRNNEGFPVEGGFKMLGGGLKSPMMEGVMIA
jgi:hypothetical protein